MKKYLLIVLVCLLCACSFHTSQSYTFNVETGEAIKVELNTTDGYSLTQENGHFAIEKDDEVLVNGMFLTMDTYNQLRQIILETDLEVLEHQTSDLVEWIFYTVEGKAGIEHNYIIKLSNTGIALGSLKDARTVKECFELLTLTVE